MVIIVSTIAFLSIVLLVTGVQDGVHGFAIWNLAPVIAAYCLILFTRRMGDYAIGALSCAIVVGGIVVFGHLAWHFDWFETASGSSTAGFTLALLPFPAVFFGLLAWSLGALIPYLRREKKFKA